MKKVILSLCAIAVLGFADTVTYTSNSKVEVYKAPSSNSSLIKTIKPGDAINTIGEELNGYVAIVGGYVKKQDLIQVEMQDEKSKDGRSMKAMIQSTFNTKEMPVSYTAVVIADNVQMRTCASSNCSSVGTKNKGDVVEIIAKTSDGSWYKTDAKAYISGKYLQIGEKTTIGTKEKASELISEKVMQNSPVKKRDDSSKKFPIPVTETVDLSKQEPISIETSEAEKSDELYAHSGELAKKYQNEALVKNLTKTATPLPVKIPARYARALDFPILNKDGDVYTDYTYVWIKITDEQFVLGKREGKGSSNGQFTINKKVN